MRLKLLQKLFHFIIFYIEQRKAKRLVIIITMMIFNDSLHIYIFKIMIPLTNIDTTESIQGKLLQENVVESSTQIPSPLEYLEFYSFL